MVRIRSLVSTGWGHHVWGRSSLGRALGWQSRGSQFDPDRLHQTHELADKPRTKKICNRSHSTSTHPRRSLLGKDHNKRVEHHHTMERHTPADRSKLSELV